MKSIFIVSNSAFSGKTAFTLGLALTLQEEGINIGYFKPISVGREIRPGKFLDRDLILMKKVLGLRDTIDELSPPITMRIGTYEFGKQILEDKDFFRNRIIDAYEKMKEKYDIIIIEARHQIQSLFTFGYDSITLSKNLDSKILLLSRGIIDEVILLRTLIEGMNAKLLGTVFNNIRGLMIHRIEGELTPILKRYKIHFYGYIQEKIELKSPTVEEYQQALGGLILVGKQYMTKLVESVHIGAMRTGSALKNLNRYRNYALITGGDRSDLIYKALATTDIVLLILTGNFYPDIKILIKAEDKKVPVLLVKHETSAAYNICLTVKARLSAHQTDKIALIKEEVKDNIDWKQIYDDA